MSFSQNNLVNSYSLFKTGIIQSKNKITQQQMSAEYFDDILSTKNFDMDQIQVIQMFNNSINQWDITPPSLQYINSSLVNLDSRLQISLDLKYSFDGLVIIFN